VFGWVCFDRSCPGWGVLRRFFPECWGLIRSALDWLVFFLSCGFFLFLGDVLGPLLCCGIWLVGFFAMCNLGYCVTFLGGRIGLSALFIYQRDVCFLVWCFWVIWRYYNNGVVVLLWLPVFFPFFTTGTRLFFCGFFAFFFWEPHFFFSFVYFFFFFYIFSWSLYTRFASVSSIFDCEILCCRKAIFFEAFVSSFFLFWVLVCSEFFLYPMFFFFFFLVLQFIFTFPFYFSDSSFYFFFFFFFCCFFFLDLFFFLVLSFFFSIVIFFVKSFLCVSPCNRLLLDFRFRSGNRFWRFWTYVCFFLNFCSFMEFPFFLFFFSCLSLLSINELAVGCPLQTGPDPWAFYLWIMNFLQCFSLL